MKLFATKIFRSSIAKKCQSGLIISQSLLLLFLITVITVPSAFGAFAITSHAFSAEKSSAINFLPDASVNARSITAAANVLQVGAGKQYSRVRDAADAARDGDIIEIDAGTYNGDAAIATLRANNLTLRGVGGRAHLAVAGDYIDNGKGIWVAAGSNLTIENIEFSGAAVSSRNGAGIRAEGTGLTIRNCYFHDNEDGVLAARNVQSDILIENSEFYRNGLDGVGNIHNMYINQVRSFTLRGSFTHNTRSGHNVKSRALKTVLLYNRISDEANGTASYSVNLPEGGDCYLIGNVIQKGPSADNRSAVITFGEDNFNESQVHQLTLVNNTIVDDRGASNFVRFDKTPNSATFINNIFVGGGTISTYAGTILRNNLAGSQDPCFVNRAAYDYHLTANSPALNAGVAPGSNSGFNLTPTQQYVYPTSTEPRIVSGAAIDVGAFEFASAPPINNPPSVSLTTPANNSSFTAPATIDITANAADSDGTIAKVEFYAGDIKLGEDTTAPYLFTWTNVSAGTYALTARAFDNAGASTISAAVNTTVNPVSQPPASVATFYKHCNYDASGYAVALEAGTYTLAQLQARGIQDNDISSLRVSSGYEAILYADDNFQGASWTYQSDQSCLVNTGNNDVVSSLKVQPVQPSSTGIANGTYKITAKHSGKALDVRNGSQNNGAVVQQWDYIGGNNQKWVVEALGDNTYKLTSLQSGKSLDVCGLSSDDGACIIQYDYWGGDNQKWIIEVVGNGYYKVIAKHSGKALDVSGVSLDNGVAVHQWTYYGLDNQLWKFDLITP